MFWGWSKPYLQRAVVILCTVNAARNPSLLLGLVWMAAATVQWRYMELGEQYERQGVPHQERPLAWKLTPLAILSVMLVLVAIDVWGAVV